MARRKIDKILSDEDYTFGQLSRLIRRSSQLNGWTANVRSILPRDLASGCFVSNMSKDTLTLSCVTAATATRVRFLTPEIIEKLSVLSEFHAIKNIKVRVR